LELARVRKFHLGSAFLVVLLLVVSAPVSTWLNLVSQLFVRNIAAEAVYDISVAVPLLTGILILGLLPGVVEEIIFRGVFLPIHSLRSIKAGIIISALMFSFMHMNFNQMAYTFFLGLLFAVTVVATNSILATVLMHAVFNAFNTALMYAVPALMEWAERLSEAAGEAAPSLEEVVTQGAEKIEILIMAAIFTPFAMGGLAMTAVLLYLIAKLNKREDILMSLVSKKHAEHDPVDKSVVLFNPFLLAGLGVCLAMALWSALGGNF
jgi:membrane protease YdiL (CAAX protease family)